MQQEYGSKVVFKIERNDAFLQEIIDWLDDLGIRSSITVGMSPAHDLWVATIRLPVGCEAQAAILSYWPDCLMVEKIV